MGKDRILRSSCGVIVVVCGFFRGWVRALLIRVQDYVLLIVAADGATFNAQEDPRFGLAFQSVEC